MKVFIFVNAEEFVCQSCQFAIEYCATFRATIILKQTQMKEVKDELGTGMQEEFRMNLKTERPDCAKSNSWSDVDEAQFNPPPKKTKQQKT